MAVCLSHGPSGAYVASQVLTDFNGWLTIGASLDFTSHVILLRSLMCATSNTRLLEVSLVVDRDYACKSGRSYMITYDIQRQIDTKNIADIMNFPLMNKSEC